MSICRYNLKIKSWIYKYETDNYIAAGLRSTIKQLTYPISSSYGIYIIHCPTYSVF